MTEETHNSALAVIPNQTDWTPQQKAALHQLGLTDAEPSDLAVFLNQCQRTGLDPFARQIYMIGRWESRTNKTKFTIQASIDGLRIVAQRSGQYAGQTSVEYCGEDGQWRDVWVQNSAPVAARVGVYRIGFAHPVFAVAYWREYAQTNRDGRLMGLWGSHPLVMLGKCAEALALRKAFPHDLSGIYTAEEMPPPALVRPQEWQPQRETITRVIDLTTEQGVQELREAEAKATAPDHSQDPWATILEVSADNVTATYAAPDVHATDDQEMEARTKSIVNTARKATPKMVSFVEDIVRKTAEGWSLPKPLTMSDVCQILTIHLERELLEMEDLRGVEASAIIDDYKVSKAEALNVSIANFCAMREETND